MPDPPICLCGDSSDIWPAAASTGSFLFLRRKFFQSPRGPLHTSQLVLSTCGRRCASAADTWILFSPKHTQAPKLSGESRAGLPWRSCLQDRLRRVCSVPETSNRAWECPLCPQPGRVLGRGGLGLPTRNRPSKVTGSCPCCAGCAFTDPLEEGSGHKGAVCRGGICVSLPHGPAGVQDNLDRWHAAPVCHRENEKRRVSAKRRVTTALGAGLSDRRGPQGAGPRCWSRAGGLRNEGPRCRARRIGGEKPESVPGGTLTGTPFSISNGGDPEDAALHPEPCATRLQESLDVAPRTRST